ncbi:MAG: membrane protein insertase YidC [Cytophagales bacterium]|nr:membrane protein insertase YidC [Cytophagales bacterium]
MDKNQAIGFVLMAALLMVYFYFFAPKAPVQEPGTVPDSANTITPPPQQQLGQNNSVVEQNEIKESSAHVDSSDIADRKFGPFTPVLTGSEERIALENEVISITYSTRGGLAKKVELKEYDDFQYNKPLVILDEESSELKYLVSTPYGNIDLADLYYKAEQKQLGDTSELTFTADLGDNKTLMHVYKLPKNSYAVTHQFIISGLDGEISGGKVSMIWDNFLKRLETDLKYSRNYTTINYWHSSGSMEDLSARSSDKQETTFTEPVDWFSFKQKFFTTGYVFNRPVSSGYISAEFNELDTMTVKYCKAMIDLPLSNFSGEAGPNTYYYGPNKLKILKKVAPGFSENLYLGWPIVRWINKYVIITIFNFLEKYIASYGVIIIILVFIIKLILSPLTYKSHISMAKTKALKPELDELKAKYGDDMQKMQSEQMKLYQQVGVNPLSGCIPMLLQMPILFAMFQFIPLAIEMRHVSFLWAKDLSTYDAIISWNFEIPLISSFYGNHVSLFTLLMTASTILYTWANSQATAQMQGPMKSMQYFMPLIFMFVLNSFPAGLTFYYFVSNLVSFGQIAIIRKFVDDTKIRAILEENKKKNKNKKKSKFASRLEDAMKASEEARRKKGKK